MPRMVNKMGLSVFLPMAAFASAVMADGAPQLKPEQATLPSIAPGQVRIMSIEELSSGAKPYFKHQQELYLKTVENTKMV